MGKKRNPNNNLGTLLLLGIGGYFAIKSGFLKGVFSGNVGGIGIGGGVGTGGGTAGGSSTGGGTVGGSVTAAQKASWAASIGLPVCIADAFVAQKGRLPATLDELDQWGNSTGHRHADGSWSC